MQAEVLRQRGLDYVRNGELLNALDAYQRAIEAQPDNETLYLEKTDIFLAARLPEDAEALLLETSARFPDSGAPAYNLLYFDLSELWASAGRIAKASDAMVSASTVIGPVDSSLIFRRIGDYNTDLLRLDVALSAYTTALELDPENMGTHLALGNLHLRRNSLDEALASFTTVFQASPNAIDALHGVGEIHRRLGEFEAAVLAANRVLERVPTHPGALYIRGTALVRLGRANDGRQDLLRYQSLQDDAQVAEARLRDINTYRTGGTDLVLRGHYPDAIQLLERGIAAYPDASPLFVSLGQAQSQYGQHEDAIETFLKMLEEGADESGVAHQNLAREYSIVGNVEASEQHQMLYEAGLATAPTQ